MEVHLELTGRSPLLMHNGRLADPLDPMKRAMDPLAQKRKKTPEEQEQLAQLEWMGGLYYEKGFGVYIPTINLIRSLRDAATAWKQGDLLYRATTIMDDKSPLIYDGPKEPAKLYRESNIDHRTVVIGRVRVARTRPIFRPPWSVTVVLELETLELKLEDLARIAERAGRFYGIGDARKLGFGRFDAKVS
jgi:hypothetical protein